MTEAATVPQGPTDLVPYINGPHGAVIPRCQATANRYDIDPTGGASGQCGRPAMRGLRVCDFHGGRAAQRRRLDAMVPEALDVLEEVMKDAGKDGDRLRAVENVLDRVGLARQSDVRMDVSQVRAEVEERLRELNDGKGEGVDPE